MIHLHDYRTGFPRGQFGPMLYMKDEGTKTEYPDNRAKEKDQTTDKQREDTHGEHRHREDGKWGDSGQFDVVGKGEGKGGDKAKGYGKCWHCGEGGHPRRECPKWLELRNKGDVSALKGGNSGYKGRKGKGKKGKGKGGFNGKGKGSYNYNCRNPGKGVGKGLNYYGDHDYVEAWGNGEWDYESNWNDYGYGDGYLGNVTMMMEHGGCEEEEETDRL